MGQTTETKRNSEASIFLPAPTLRKSPKINREGQAFLCNKQAQSMPHLKTDPKTFSVCVQGPIMTWVSESVIKQDPLPLPKDLWLKGLSDSTQALRDYLVGPGNSHIYLIKER